MIVDLHAHYFPKDYNTLLLRIGGRSLPEAARPITARRCARTIPRHRDASEADGRGRRAAAGALPGREPALREKEADAVEAARLIQ